jgi:murein DD-endopeptidase MepM/ murein hydrolase activator NlpD
MMDDTTSQDDTYAAWLKKLRDGLGALEKTGLDPQIIELLKSFLSLFTGLLGDDPAAPDFEDAATPAERARAEKEYKSGREAAERARYGDFTQSAQAWTASSLAQSSAQLIAMRKAAEALNGGKPVEAISPVAGQVRISSEFGHREASETGGIGSTEHQGLDMAPLVRGTNLTVVAPMPGIVVGKGWRGGYGNMLEIMDIYGVKHRFGHLESIDVKVGESVRQGEPVAVMGMTGHATGVHLHYEQRDGNGVPRNPQINGHVWGNGQLVAATAIVPKTASAPTGPYVNSAADHGVPIDDTVRLPPQKPGVAPSALDHGVNPEAKAKVTAPHPQDHLLAGLSLPSLPHVDVNKIAMQTIQSVKTAIGGIFYG